MAVMVEAVMTSSTKKSLRVKLGNIWYGAALASGLADKKGKYITVEIVTLDNGPWINKWAPVAPPQATPPIQTGQSPSGPVPTAGASYEAQYWQWANEESQRNYSEKES